MALDISHLYIVLDGLSVSKFISDISLKWQSIKHMDTVEYDCTDDSIRDTWNFL